MNIEKQFNSSEGSNFIENNKFRPKKKSPMPLEIEDA